MDFLPVFAERHDSRFTPSVKPDGDPEGLNRRADTRRRSSLGSPQKLRIDMALRNGMIAVPYGYRFNDFCRERPCVVPLGLQVDLALRNGMIAVSLQVQVL